MITGMPVPPKIAAAPELELGLQIFLIAFFDLLGERQFGFSAGPIPYLAVDRYCDQLGVDAEARATMHHHIQRMDKVYNEHFEKKRNKKIGKEGKPRGKRSRGLRPPDA